MRTNHRAGTGMQIHSVTVVPDMVILLNADYSSTQLSCTHVIVNVFFTLTIVFIERNAHENCVGHKHVSLQPVHVK